MSECSLNYSAEGIRIPLKPLNVSYLIHILDVFGSYQLQDIKSILKSDEYWVTLQISPYRAPYRAEYTTNVQKKYAQSK